jgi:hypothetical protein
MLALGKAARKTPERPTFERLDLCSADKPAERREWLKLDLREIEGLGGAAGGYLRLPGCCYAAIWCGLRYSWK